MNEWIQKRWVYHTLTWGLVITIYIFGISWGVAKEDPSWILFSILLIAISIILTYAHFYLLDHFFLKRRYGLYVILVITLSLTFVLLTELHNMYGPTDIKITDPPVKNFFSFLIICAAGAGVRYFKRGLIYQFQLQELKAKNAEIELNMLKTQLNPHFLFNTINNICGVNQISSEKGTEMLMELADLLRYHLSYSKVDTISLSEELELLDSYVALEKLRLTESSKVQLSFPAQTNGIRIPPLLFMPLIENAFKHGTHPSKPSFINVEVQASDKEISLTVENSIHQNLNNFSTQIGLENTRRRLELLFPQRHRFQTHQTAEMYKAQLLIQL